MTVPTQPAAGNAWEVFRAFLRLGLTSFGGPVAHLGYFHEEFVTQRKWLTERQFAGLLALCQFLPGPASSQLGFAIGIGRAGFRGGVAAWLAFPLPSALLMVGFAAGAAHVGGPLGDGVFAGLKAVAVAVVTHAVWTMARTLTPDARRIIIAAVSAAIVLLVATTWGQLAAIAFGLVAGIAFCRNEAKVLGEDRQPYARVSKGAAITCLTLLAGLLLVLPLLAAMTKLPLLGFADGFARAGALVFGGGHVVLPLLQAEPVISAAVTQQQFLAGYGAAQALPGPLFSFAAYLGAVAEPSGGLIAAAVALLAVFAPGLLLLVGVLPFWNRVSEAASARSAMRGANAAVVGLLAAALYDPIIVTGMTGPAVLVIALACLALLMMRVKVWLVVLLGVAGGALIGLLSIGASWS